MQREFTGGCACGAVRYAMVSEPMFVHCCHCLDCQRQTGSAFVINAMIETDRIKLLSGRPEPVGVPTDSGRSHDIYRCPNCRVALWSDYGGRSYLRFVRVGTLDEPHSITPDVHIFARSKVPWVALPPDVPAFEEFYDLRSQWPESAQARRKAASAAARAS
jgi:hypothetical protein